MSGFDALAGAYDLGRLGYANDVYNSLIAYGLAPSHAVLDIGCGTALASAPLIQNGYAVTGIDESERMIAVARANFPQAEWVVGRAEALPFSADRFDVALAAQVFHHVDKAAALAQVLRVLRPRGIAAIWWKNLLGDDPVSQLRDSVARDLKLEPLGPLWRTGFKEFYAAGFSETALRVVPWSTVTTLSRFVQYERSRKIIHETYGAQANGYFAHLEERLHESFGAGDPLVPLSYLHYVYLAKK